jgi:hypothetical protein
VQASGQSTGYGSDLPVTLNNDPGATHPVSLYQSNIPWHIMVSGSPDDPNKILRIKAFVEAQPIEHPIYRNSAIAETRATAELDAKTHARTTYTVQLGLHLPAVAEGSTAAISSTSRDINDTGQVLRHRIRGGANYLTSTIDIVTFQPVTR